MKAFDAKSIIAEEVAALLGGRAGSLVDGEIIAGDGAKITLLYSQPVPRELL